MLRFLLFFARYFLFWIAFFQVGRLFFIVSNSQEWSASFSEIIKSIWYGISLDLSAAGYIMLPPLVYQMIGFLLKKSFQSHIRIYTLVLLIICSLLIGIDARLYSYWGFRIDGSSLLYLQTPDIVFGSLYFLDYLLPIVTTLLFSFLFYVIYKNWVIDNYPRKRWSALIGLGITALLFPVIRGGFGIVPLNVSKVYYSYDSFSNHAAINPFWNLAYSLSKNEGLSTSTYTLTPDESVRGRSPIFQSGESKNILNIDRPNILLVMMEGISAKLIAGEDHLPGIKNLMDHSINFTQFYASGDRTDRGLVAILSGYPSQPANSILKYPSKSKNLPSLLNVLKEQGYSTQFAYGGDLSFANMKAYLQESQPSDWLEQSDFPSETYARWGVHDHVLLDSLFNQLETFDPPFFTSVLTLSSHEPFDVPLLPDAPLENREDQYLHAVKYTDQSIENFIKKLKDTPLWDNTLVILVADHGHRLPGNDPVNSPQRFKIPMLWTGGAINNEYFGSYGDIASQTDIATTLLHQLNIDTSEFNFGRDLFSSPTPFAWYAYNEGYGILSDEATFTININSQQVQSFVGSPNDSLMKITTAYYEYLMRDFELK